MDYLILKPIIERFGARRFWSAYRKKLVQHSKKVENANFILCSTTPIPGIMLYLVRAITFLVISILISHDFFEFDHPYLIYCNK